MNRLFRQPRAGLSSYAALVVFAAVYLTAMTMVVDPGAFRSVSTELIAQAQHRP